LWPQVDAVRNSSAGRAKKPKEHIMTVTISKSLRNALHLDALVSGAAALIMVAGAPLLSPLLNLPAGLLVGAGLLLVPFVAMLVIVARRKTVARLVLVDIIGLNALWVAMSFGVIVSGLVAPNALGIAFISAQAIAVALFAELQYVGLRRAVRAIAA
jgi:hypothetical protein